MYLLLTGHGEFHRVKVITLSQSRELGEVLKFLKRSTLTLLRLQPRFGDTLLRIRLVSPKTGLQS